MNSLIFLLLKKIDIVSIEELIINIGNLEWFENVNTREIKPKSVYEKRADVVNIAYWILDELAVLLLDEIRK